MTTVGYEIKLQRDANTLKHSKSKTECTLKFKQPRHGQRNLHKTAKLLKITFSLDNATGIPDSVIEDSDLFQPLKWKRVSGTHGNGLLQLIPIYEMLSLSLLSYETENSFIDLQSKPTGCITNLTDLEYEMVFRKFLLNFTKEYEEICNEHIENISGEAEFYYECCHYDYNGKMQCNRVLKNIWMRAIHYCSYIVIAIVSLYCPLLIPPSLYNPNFGPKQFGHCLKDHYTFTVSITQTNCWKEICKRFNKLMNIDKKYVPYYKFESMTKFLKKVGKMNAKNGYQFKLSKVYFNVDPSEIVAENEVPISLISALRDLLFGCGMESDEGVRNGSQTSEVENEENQTSCCNKFETKIQTACCQNSKMKNQEGVKACCKANIFGACVHINYPWYKLWGFLLRFVFAVAICLPWIIRVCIFYVYEYDIRESRHKAAETRNFLVRIENNLTYYGTPVHVVFILSYALMCFGYLFFELISVILFKNITSLLRKILTEIFNSMCNRSKGKVIRWSIRVLLKPFTACGMFGVVFAIPFWIFAVPFTFTVSAYYLFPTFHITINFLRLFVDIFRTCNLKSDKSSQKNVDKNCCYSFFSFQDICSDNRETTTSHEATYNVDQEGNTTSHEVTDNDDQDENTTSHEVTDNVDQQETKPILYEIGLMFILLCMMLSFVLLTFEFVIFFMKVATYTMVGLILNSSHAMQYISTISLAWLYYNRCFGGISQIYKNFNKAVQTILYRVNELRADEITKQEMKDRKYKAFKVSNKSITEGNIGTYDRDPKFKTKGVVLLFDKDKQYTTKKFFFNICKKLPDGPGPYSKRYGIALRHFCVIFLFLLFVTLVVIAFGDSYSVSFPNQLLATLAGGVVPWILMKTNILFSQDDPPDVDEIYERYFHKQKNSESDAEGLFNMFKKTFDDEIEKDSKWWIIGDMDVTDTSTVNVEPSKADLLIWNGRESTYTKRKTVENPLENKNEGEGLIKKDQ
ncbi:Hypothetical predicted protein [Mytilus galloprovincialis]|uniref:Uncharacterized protein n=1 Tax=Mytilus galloprovincialis TaxID=29158 RepID=A0A8B6CKV0_MYTGA|nr:Hypothetical predicted protein [Mytilus galloprovincialis]